MSAHTDCLRDMCVRLCVCVCWCLSAMKGTNKAAAVILLMIGILPAVMQSVQTSASFPKGWFYFYIFIILLSAG